MKDINKFYLNAFNMGESFIDLFVENLLVLVVVRLSLTLTVVVILLAAVESVVDFGDMWRHKYAEYISAFKKAENVLVNSRLVFPPNTFGRGFWLSYSWPSLGIGTYIHSKRLQTASMRSSIQLKSKDSLF